MLYYSRHRQEKPQLYKSQYTLHHQTQTNQSHIHLVLSDRWVTQSASDFRRLNMMNLSLSLVRECLCIMQLNYIQIYLQMHTQLSTNVENVSHYPQTNAKCLWNSELHEHAVICTNRNMFVNADVFTSISVSEFAHATRKMSICAFVGIFSESILFASFGFWDVLCIVYYYYYYYYY